MTGTNEDPGARAGKKANEQKAIHGKGPPTFAVGCAKALLGMTRMRKFLIEGTTYCDALVGALGVGLRGCHAGPPSSHWLSVSCST